MTNEQAIKWLKDYIQNTPFQMEQYERAFEMAIQALSQEPTNEKELNKAYTFGHNRGVKAYYNEQLCTVELPEAVFRYILSLVPTEEAEQEPCDDAISRESVDRILRDMGVHCAYDMPSFWANKGKDYKVIPTKWHKGYQQAVADFDKRIRELPSVTQKSGKWIYRREDKYSCSKCGTTTSVDESGIDEKPMYKFCPYCGAKMESEE